MTKMTLMLFLLVVPMFADHGPPTVTCASTIAAGTAINGNLLVPPGAVCTLNGVGTSIVTVHGNVTVQGTLWGFGTHITGDVNVINGGRIQLLYDSLWKTGFVIDGNVTLFGYSHAALYCGPWAWGHIHGNVTAVGGQPQVKDQYSYLFDLEGTIVDKAVTVLMNRGSGVIGNLTAASVVLADNRGEFWQMVNVKAGKLLSCIGNTPNPTGTGISAEHEIGQCANMQ
jgi:hypothetical protein